MEAAPGLRAAAGSRQGALEVPASVVAALVVPRGMAARLGPVAQAGRAAPVLAGLPGVLVPLALPAQLVLAERRPVR